MTQTNSRHRPHQAVRGFTILEALIAALIVGVAMLALGKLQGVNLANSAESRMRTHALNLAQSKIEEHRSFANQSQYDNYGSFTSDSEYSELGEDRADGPNATFIRTWSGRNCPASNSTPVMCIDLNVEVNWTDAKGVIHSVQLTSFIARADPVSSAVALLK
jgi:Tfp pilus assembly protein PilV